MAEEETGTPENFTPTSTAELTRFQQNSSIYVHEVYVEITEKMFEQNIIILGCVRAVRTSSLDIELPGRVYGTLPIRHVPLDYDNTREMNPLKNIFQIGEMLPVKVVERSEADSNVRLTLSSKPSHINSNIFINNIDVGSLIWASIVQKLDNSYILNAETEANYEIILPFDEAEENSCVIGKPLWCVVKTVNIQDLTITVSTLQKDVINQIQLHEISLQHLLPGTKVQFTIEDIAQSGLKGKLFDTYNCLVPQTYLDRSKNYLHGDVVRAQVLFVEPRSKTVYLSLNIMNYVMPKGLLKIGSTVNGKVTSTTDNGLIMNIDNSTIVGLITFKQLSNVLKVPIDSIEAVISKKYNINSKHLCRILDYSYIENIYLCNIIKSKNKTSPEDVQVGQIVNGKIREINEGGIVLIMNSLQGFVPNLYITDEKYQESSKKKFFVGQSVSAKIVLYKENQILLTMKQSLIQSDSCLCNLKRIDLKKEYFGTVIRIIRNSVTICFYNGILGILKEEEFSSPNHYYYVGQVIPVYVKEIKKTKLVLSLKLKQYECKIHVGQIVDGIVTDCINNESLIVEIDNEDAIAILPLAHLNDNVEYAKYLLEKHKIGDKINGLLCVSSNEEEIVVSHREADYYSGKKLPQIHSLKVGELLRCSFSHVSNEGFVFTAPILSCDYKIIVLMTEITSNLEDLQNIKFTPHQLVIVKIQSINEQLQEIRGTAKLDEVFTHRYEESLENLSKYFEYVDQCKSDLLKKNNLLANITEGSIVRGCIAHIGAKRDFVIELDNGLKGFVHSKHTNRTRLKEGDSVECVVLYVDFMQEHVDLSFLKKYAPVATTKKEGPSLKDYRLLITTVLLVKANFVQCLTRGKELVYLPTSLHPNDFMSCITSHKDKILGDAYVYIIRQLLTRKLGVSKSTMNSLEMYAVKQQELEYEMQQLKHKFLANDSRHFTIKRRRIVVQNDEETDEDSDALDDESNLLETLTACNISMNSSGLLQEVMLDDSDHDSEENITRSPNEISHAAFSENNFEQNITQNVQQTEAACCSKNANPVLNNENHETLIDLEHLDNPMEAFIAKNRDEPIQENHVEQNLEEEVININSSKDASLLTESNKEFATVVQEKTKNRCLKDEDKKCKKSKIELEDVQPSLSICNETFQSSSLHSAVINSKNIENDDGLKDIHQHGHWKKHMASLFESGEMNEAREISYSILKKFNSHKVIYKISECLLSLENIHGTKDSFDKALETIVRYCKNHLKIYFTAMNILGKSHKFTEMDIIIKKCRNRFQLNPEMWIRIGELLYKYQRLQTARDFTNFITHENKSIRLQVLLNYAKFEFQYGDKSQGELLFENMLLSYPSNERIWLSYTKRLIQHQQYDSARKVFKRAVAQKWNHKHLKLLFKTYIQFEEIHGSKEDFENAKSLHNDYAKNLNRTKNLLLDNFL